MQVPCHAADAQADTCVLHSIIRIEQLGARSLPALLGIHHHFFQPAGGQAPRYHCSAAAGSSPVAYCAPKLFSAL